MVGVDDSFEALVDVVAFNPMCGFEQLVVPGDPEQSLLWHRVLPVEEGQGEPCVPKMPAGTSGLSVEDAQRVYDWIAAGAPR
jgi:hypothetical protein